MISKSLKFLSPLRAAAPGNIIKEVREICSKEFFLRRIGQSVPSKAVALPIVLVALVILTGLGMSVLMTSMNRSETVRNKRHEAQFNQRLLSGLEDGRQALINQVQNAITQAQDACTPNPDFQIPQSGIIPLEQCQEFAGFEPSSPEFMTGRDRFELTCISAGPDNVMDSSACTTAEDSLPHTWSIRYRSSLASSEGSISGSVRANIIVAREKLKDYSLMISSHDTPVVNFGGGNIYSGKVYVGFDEVDDFDSNDNLLANQIRFLNSEPLVFKELLTTSLEDAEHIVEGNPDAGLDQVEVDLQKGLLLSAPQVQGTLTSSFQDLENTANWKLPHYRDSATVKLYETASGDCKMEAASTYQYTDCSAQTTCMIDNNLILNIDGGMDDFSADSCEMEVETCNIVTQTDPITNSPVTLSPDEKYSMYLNSGKTYFQGQNDSDVYADTCGNLTVASEGDNYLKSSIRNTTRSHDFAGSENPMAIVSLGGTNYIPGSAKSIQGDTMQDISRGAGGPVAADGQSFVIQASLVGLGGAYLSLPESLLDLHSTNSTLGELRTLGSLVGKTGAVLRNINIETGETVSGFYSISSTYDPGVGANPPIGFNESEGGGLEGTTVSIQFESFDVQEAISYWQNGDDQGY